MKVIDQLPTGPEWSCELVRPHRDAENDARVAGDEGEGEQEELELWMHDPVACIRELIGNTAFNSEIAYAPEKIYTNNDGHCWCYDEMWTGEWWWDIQVSRQSESTPMQLNVLYRAVSPKAQPWRQ